MATTQSQIKSLSRSSNCLLKSWSLCLEYQLEALLLDRGTNLLSHLMKDVCAMLGTKKLNTTAYHPQCDGMVERFNRTLWTMLRKHAASYGPQWDKYLSGVLWAYRNTPHDSTGEKLSFLLFGVDCHSPTDAVFLLTAISPGISFTDYRQELMASLHSAWKLATQSIQEAQQQYKINTTSISSLLITMLEIRF